MRYQVLDSDGKLQTFLKLVEEVRKHWINDDAKCVGDEAPPWFRGQGDSSWGLIPKIYRSEFFTTADEKELRHEFQSAAIQIIGPTAPKTNGIGIS